MTLTDFLLARVAEDEAAAPQGEPGRGDWLAWCQGKRRGARHPGRARLLALPYADHPDYDESWRPQPPESMADHLAD